MKDSASNPSISNLEKEIVALKVENANRDYEIAALNKAVIEAKEMLSIMSHNARVTAEILNENLERNRRINLDGNSLIGGW